MSAATSASSAIGSPIVLDDAHVLPKRKQDASSDDNVKRSRIVVASSSSSTAASSDSTAVQSTKQHDQRTQAAQKWFSVFYSTQAMIDADREKFGQDYDYEAEMKQHAEDMKAYAEQKTDYDEEQATLKRETEARGEVYVEDVRYRPDVPPTPVRHAAHTMLQGPLDTFVLAQTKHWNDKTMRNIIARAVAESADSDNKFVEKPNQSRVKTVNRVVRCEYETAEPCLATRVWIDLMRGVVRKANADVIDAEDLDKVALAHGSSATERTAQLADIYASQRTLLQEIVDNGYNFEDNARGFCIAHALLNDLNGEVDNASE